jgi:hypothetical protein
MPDSLVDRETITKVAEMNRDLENLTKAVDKLTLRVEELNGYLNQAKGARWLFLVLVAAVGMIGGWVGKMFTITPIR